MLVITKVELNLNNFFNIAVKKNILLRLRNNPRFEI